MITTFLLFTAQAFDPSAPMTMHDVRFQECIDLALDDPNSGVVDANKWRIEGGGVLAMQCLGFAHAENLDWIAARLAFVDAAEQAEVEKHPRTAQLWAQAGNAALAEGAADFAVNYLNSAMVQGTLTGLAKGEAHLDLARAYVILEKYDEARTQFASVQEYAPQDPLGWLLSATLARRMNDLGLAKSDIAVAAKLAGGDPAVALEAGNIAYAAGDDEGAKSYWKQASELDAASLPARTAADYLARLETQPTKPPTEEE